MATAGKQSGNRGVSSRTKPRAAKKAEFYTGSGTEGGRHDPTLGRYFQELADHDVLGGDEETEAAKEIAELEHELWRMLLGEPRLVCRLQAIVGQLIKDNYDAEDSQPALRLFTSLKRKTSNGAKSARATRGRDKTVAELAGELHTLDIKRVLIEASLKEAALQTSGSRPALGKRRSKKLAEQLRCSTGEIASAKHRFIQANLRLVVAIARRYDRGLMPLIDLIQEGNLGLIKAVDRFDYRRGFRFSTYASWWIRHAIGRALADKGQAVRIPVHALDTQHRISRAAEMIGLRLGRPPTDDELAEEAGIDRRRLNKARLHPIVPVCSLDREISSSDNRRYIDLLADEDGKSPFESTMLRAWMSDMDAVLGVLSPMEQSIIRWRFGLDDGDELTLKEIGDHYSLSRERIRQLQEQALRKIRRHLALDAA